MQRLFSRTMCQLSFIITRRDIQIVHYLKADNDGGLFGIKQAVLINYHFSRSNFHTGMELIIR